MKNAQWECVQFDDGDLLVVHVIPVDDLREHEFDNDCWCSPELEYSDDGLMVSHNSLDGREMYEAGIRKPH